MKTTNTETFKSKILETLLKEIPESERRKVEKRMLLAVKLDNAIKAKGWKKTEFAKIVKKHPSEISKWLSGTHNFTFDTLVDIERILDIELINIKEKPEKYSINFNIQVSHQAEDFNSKLYSYFNEIFEKPKNSSLKSKVSTKQIENYQYS